MLLFFLLSTLLYSRGSICCTRWAELFCVWLCNSYMQYITVQEGRMVSLLHCFFIVVIVMHL